MVESKIIVQSQAEIRSADSGIMNRVGDARVRSHRHDKSYMIAPMLFVLVLALCFCVWALLKKPVKTKTKKKRKDKNGVIMQIPYY